MKIFFCLSESCILLHRNYSNVRNWKLFVANHVREIQNLAPTQWKFCKGKGKPADIVSRGYSATELVSTAIWFYGPILLKWEPIRVFSPETPTNIADEEVLEQQRKTHACPASQDILEFELLFKFPSWTKLSKIMTCCLKKY